MKNKLMHVFDKIVLRKRGMIDSMIGQLKEICQIEHSRHRRSVNCIVNLLSGLAGYSLKANKPRINLQKSSLKFLSDLAV